MCFRLVDSADPAAEDLLRDYLDMGGGLDVSKLRVAIDRVGLAGRDADA